MAINIMNEYINIVKKQIYTYMKLIFGSKLKKTYSDIYTYKYISIRYYNLEEKKEEVSFKQKILNSLKSTKEDMSINYIEDRILIEQIYIFFQYFLYLDNVIEFQNIESVIEEIAEERKKILKIEDQKFETKLYEQIKKIEQEKKEFLEKFQTEDFYIKISNYPNEINIQRVNLHHNIQIKPIYSQFAIEKAFNTGIINEDKLVIEYYLTVLQILKDITMLNFKKQYIVEFTDTILDKKKKLKGLLNSINNEIIQEKIILKLKYENVIVHKQIIYELLRNGYQIAIIIDDTFDNNIRNIDMIKVFNYVIVNKEHELYKDIIKNKEKLGKIIEI